MNKKLIRLAERRERLVTRAAEQRVALAQNIEPYRLPLALADQGINALRYIRSHPEWLVGVVVLLAALRPSRAPAISRRGQAAVPQAGQPHRPAIRDGS